MGAYNHKKYDVIIIGSGLGGLSAGAYLSRKGKRVLVLERHYQIGGYASGFKRKNFTFDVSLHMTGGIRKTFYKDILEQCGVYDRVQFVKPKYLYEIWSDDGRVLKVENGNVEKLKKELFNLFPKEKRGIRLWFYLLQRIGKELNRYDKMDKMSKLSFYISMALAPFIRPVLLISYKISLQTILDICTKNKELQSILMQLIGYYGDSYKIASQLPMISDYGYYFDSGYYIAGGSQSLSNAFKEVIEENGGSVMVLKEVTEIILKEDKAVGVKTKDDEFYGDYIIANASPFVVYEKLLKRWRGSKKELEKMKSMEIGTSLSQIYIGLKDKIKNLFPHFKDSYIIFIRNSKETSKEWLNYMVLVLHSNVDPKLQSKEKDVINITFVDNYHRWNKENYKQKKEEELKEIIKFLSTNYLPGLEENIEIIEYATPKTMERYTLNEMGAVYGFSQKVGQAGFDRFGNKGPIKNLFFASAWAFPGGGFEGAIRSGYWTAKMISG